LVQTAAAHYLSSIATVGAATAAALDATLTIYREPETSDAAFSIPVWQLLSAPLANLKQRAERLAELIAATSQVASAEPCEMERSWLTSGGASLVSPTWVVAITPTGDVTKLVSHLRQWEHPIAAEADSGVIHLDLRSIFPRWDQQLVAVFEGLTS
jgi:L-seryl-tRNA(Ser) seleniumtransferase